MVEPWMLHIGFEKLLTCVLRKRKSTDWRMLPLPVKRVLLWRWRGESARSFRNILNKKMEVKNSMRWSIKWRSFFRLGGSLRDTLMFSSLLWFRFFWFFFCGVVEGVWIMLGILFRGVFKRVIVAIEFWFTVELWHGQSLSWFDSSKFCFH